MKEPTFCVLSRERMLESMEEIIRISNDIPHDDWTEQKYLKELPGKWELSRICCSGGEILGYIIASEKEPGTVHIHKFAVRKEARGRGLGRLMLQDLAGEVKGETRVISLKVYEDNSEAVGFYRKMNFSVTGHEKDMFVMELRLQ
jgi:ribosomal protein S18 acetylase RimI-like enzyme